MIAQRKPNKDKGFEDLRVFAPVVGQACECPFAAPRRTREVDIF
jgi:hypothetical protein